METILQDLRYSVRALRNSPMFTIVALATLGVGIGVNTALFGIVNTVLLRPLPVANPERVLEIMTTDDDPPGPQSRTAMSLPDLRDYNAQTQALSGIAGHSLFFAALSDGSSSKMVLGEIVTGNYFSVLGARVAVGRPLTPEGDLVRDGHAVMVISHNLWRSRFNSDPAAVGQTLALNGTTYEIVGVAAPEFTGAFASVATPLWIPTMMAEQVEPAGTNDVSPSPGDTRLERRGHRWLSVKARLRDEISVERATAEMEAIGLALAEAHPDVNQGRRPVLLEPGSLRIHPGLDAAFSSVVGFLFGIVGLLLLVTCANVANMLLARATTRGREVAIRAALGADRRRLVRQMITESLLLGLGGGAVGMAIGVWLTGLLARTTLPVPVELPIEFAFDWRVFAFAAGVSVVTGLIFGVAPAMRATRADLVSALRGTGAVAAGGSRIQSGLLVAQIAISFVLLVSAAFFVSTARAAHDVDLGVDADRVVVLGFALEMNGYTDEEAVDFFPRALLRFAEMPGVESATYSTGLPLNTNIHYTAVVPEGVEPRPGSRGYSIARSLVGPDYFRTVGLEQVRGRLFDERDNRDGRLTTIVNEAFVARFWPGEDAVGKTVSSAAGREWVVVGVVRDHKVSSVAGPSEPYIYYSWAQSPSPFANVLVRTSGPAADRVADVQQQMLAIEPELVFMQAETFVDMARVLLLPLRLAAALLIAFASVGGLLATIGLYGAVAQAVGRRTRELGIRKALGAGRARVIQQVASGSVTIVAVALTLGLAAAYAGARTFSRFLFGVTPESPAPYIAGLLALLAVLAISHWFPARRAARIDPMTALRQD